MTTETRICQNCKKNFTIELEDFNFYKKISVPPPTWCPQCRMIRRFTHKNERNLYRVKDAHTGKEIFSGIPPHAPIKIYEQEFWWSDGWDPMEYGREYDFKKPFFVQFRELMREVPFPSRNITQSVNSDYSDSSGDLKNCYLCFNSGRMENSAYVINSTLVKESYDIIDAASAELSYDCLSIGGAYKLFFSMYCGQSENLWFCWDCVGCSNCFGCVNLRNKRYYIFNQPHTREEYFEKLKNFRLDSYAALEVVKEQIEWFWTLFPRKYIRGVKNFNVSGDYVNFSKNVRFSFGIEGGEDLKYCQEIYRQKGYWEGGKDSYDYYNWGYSSELMYEVCGSGQGCRNMKFCLDCWPADQDLEYCMRCVSSNNLFGCIGLQKKSYCIFNKQYSRDDFLELREKIIAHMNEAPYTDAHGRIYKYGEFFPPEFSLFGYNETVAQDYFPLTKDEAEKHGYVWREIERREYEITIDAKDLPDSVTATSDSILKEVIGCISCKRAYRIIQGEYTFLRFQTIALPRLCPDCRYLKRFSYRNRPKLYERECDCKGMKSKNGKYKNAMKHSHNENQCSNSFVTAYTPEKPEIVYCEQCYQAEVV
ncbi:MAG: hypothetical protein HY433_03320 [Candidatus Liptonbacteria bacterium]|nr:hypothetical protein [Candidatus Liptonbacteria bacterium]